MNEKELKKFLEEREAKENKDVNSLGQDPWKLKSGDVEDDWTEMRAPPLAMFSSVSPVSLRLGTAHDG